VAPVEAQATESPLDAALAAQVAPAEVVSAEMKHVDAAPAAASTGTATAGEALEEARLVEEAPLSVVDTTPAADETPVEVAPEERLPANAAQAPPSPEKAPEEVVPPERTPAEAPQKPPAAAVVVAEPVRTETRVEEPPVQAAPAESAPAELVSDAEIAPGQGVLGERATAKAQPEEVTKAELTSEPSELTKPDSTGEPPEAAQEPPIEVSSADVRQVDNAVVAEAAPTETKVEEPPAQAVQAETVSAESVPDAEITPERVVLGDAATAKPQPEEVTNAEPTGEPSEVTKADPTSEPPEACVESTDSMEDSKVCSPGANMLGEDSHGREELIKTLNERCLGFLSEQLPLLKIPQIHSVEDGLEYTIDNVDLSAFKINADSLKVVLAPSADTCHDTDPILDREPPAPKEESAVSCATNGGEESKPKVHERDAVLATAADLGVTVPKLKWSYQQTGFPYLNGLGTACACLSSGSVTLAFQLHRADVDGEIIPQLTLSSCSVFIDSLTVVEVSESVFSWVYNRLAFMLQDQVRQYIASSLQAALSDNIAFLLTALNTNLAPHWPMLLSAMGFTAEVLPLAGDAAKPVAPKKGGDAKNHIGGWPPPTPPTSPTAAEEAAAAAAAAAAEK